MKMLDSEKMFEKSLDSLVYMKFSSKFIDGFRNKNSIKVIQTCSIPFVACWHAAFFER